MECFLEGRIGFIQIADIIEQTMNAHQSHSLTSVEQVLQADRWGRDMAREICIQQVN